MKRIAVWTIVVMSTLVSTSPVWAGVSANVGLTSNYIWRGITQSDDKAALQAGLDYKAKNGFYAGTWASNVKFTDNKATEVDLYTGFANELKGGLSYDIGAIRYAYPDETDWDVTEAFAKFGFKGFTTELGYVTDKDVSGDINDKYYALGYNGKIGTWGYGLKAGKVDIDGAGDDYSHTQVSLTKTIGKAGDLIVAVDKASSRDEATAGSDANDAKASIMWKKSFDF